MVHRGLILCIGKDLYSVDEGCLVLHDNVDQQVLEDILLSANKSIDEELLLLPDIGGGGVESTTDGDDALSDESLSFTSNAGQPSSSKRMELDVAVDDDDGDEEVVTKRRKRQNQNQRVQSDDDEDNTDVDDDKVVPKKTKRQPLSSEDEEDGVSFLKLEANIGDWVVVQYDNSPYVGVVKGIHASAGYQVATLNNCGNSNCFKWSTDNIWYKELLARDIDEPEPANNRGALKLSDKDYDLFKKLF